VVTSSVAIAGVLLVFCYLIVPSVAGMLFAKTIGKRLAIAWTMGTGFGSGDLLIGQTGLAYRSGNRLYVWHCPGGDGDG